MTLDENDRKVNAEGADVSNWRTPPFNGWAFHNVREIIPTADIEAAPGRALVFPETPLSLSDRLDWGGAVGFFARSARLPQGRRDGSRWSCCARAASSTNSERTPHILMSSTKAIVGLIAGILRWNGDLNVDDLVSDYVPEIGKTGYQGAAIRQLLDMRTGVNLDAANRATTTLRFTATKSPHRIKLRRACTPF